MVSSYPSKTVLPATATPPSPVAPPVQSAAPLAASLLHVAAVSLSAWPLPPQQHTEPAAAVAPPIAVAPVLAMQKEVRDSDGYIPALRQTIVKRYAQIKRMQRQLRLQKLENQRRIEAEIRAEKRRTENEAMEAEKMEKAGTTKAGECLFFNANSQAQAGKCSGTSVEDSHNCNVCDHAVDVDVGDVVDDGAVVSVVRDQKSE